MNDALRLMLLGGLQVALGQVPITGFISNKAPALLAYLAVSGRPHSRPALAGLLWSDVPEANARKSLSMVLSNLRRLVPPHLVITRQDVAFNREHPYWLDVEAFHQRVSEILQQQGNALTDEQVTSLEQAVALYRGSFLEGFYVRDAPLFEEWVLLERERLRQLALQSLHTLVAYHTAQGAYAAGIEYISRLLAIEPWQEEAHRQLMWLLALSGRRSAALAQYEACRRILIEELGVEPEEETTALYEEIKAGMADVERPTLTIPLTNLPPPVIPLIGREDELAQLGERLLDPDYRLVTLVGAGGVGKTRLALAAAEQLVDRFAHGVWFVPLAGVGGPTAAAEIPSAALALTVANALNFTFYGRGNPRAQLLDYLRYKEMLLLLDNFEHLLAEADFVLEVLQNAPRVTVLVTSRERLNFQAEYTMRIEGLPVPASAGDPSAASYSSVRLFAERADRTPAGFVLDEPSLSGVVRVCQLVEGLPLGIEWAAAWVNRLSSTKIARSIEQNLDFLATSMRDVPERHQSMRAVFESSWQLLSQTEQLVLTQASVFRGGFTQEAVLAVTAARAVDLASLVDKSLLRRTASGRYELHELLRQFAAEKLEFGRWRLEAGEWKLEGEPDLRPSTPDLQFQVRDRHSTYYLDLLARREETLMGRVPQMAAAEIQREWDNVQQAWRWAATHTSLEALERSSTALSRFLYLKGLFQQGEGMLKTAVECLKAGGATEDPTGEAQKVLSGVLVEQAEFLNRRAMYDRAIAEAQEAIRLAQAGQDVGIETRGRLVWGRALALQGNYETALTQVERATDLAQGTSLLRLQGDCFLTRALVLLEKGDHNETARNLGQALRICQETGDRQRESSVLNELGLVAMFQNDYAKAKVYLEQVLRITREIGDRRMEDVVLDNLGLISTLLGDYDQARVYLEQSLYICREIGDRQGESETLYDRALLFHSLGDDESAREHSQQSLRIAEQIGNPEIKGFALLYLGHALAGLGHLADAADAYRAGLDLRREQGRSIMAPTLLAGLARVAMAQGDLPQAQAHVQEILASLEPEMLASFEEPLQVCLTCYRVLRANEDPRAPEVLRTAHRLLQEQAGKIDDDDLRRMFLENVGPHREIVRESKRVLPSAPEVNSP